MPGEPVTIRNLSPNQVLLRFKSGNSHYLGPRAVLEGVEPVEVTGNRWIAHLRERRLIAVEPRGGKKGRLRSRSMRAKEAIKHIHVTPLAELEGFLSDDEDRVTVLQAMEEKRGV
jgi:hypothetical protein